MRLLAIALLFTACASQPAPPPAASSTAPAPVETKASWTTRVAEAKGLADEAGRNEAMLALMREALAPHHVRLSGTNNAEHVDPADNQPAPVINFDPRLQEKRSAVQRAGGATRSLKNNFGYYFSRDGRGYVVLGPAALDRRDPIFTQLAAEHELYHAMNHVGDPRPLNDRELETWSKMFEAFFPRIHQYRQQWAPMLRYYNNASDAERAAAVQRLLSVYQSGDDKVRQAFEEWLSRRREDHAASKMVADLSAAIGWTS